MSGTVNGYNLGEVDLHSYIVTEDGRTFTAISRIPPSIGFSMQSLYLVTDILGWLFASPQTAQAKNGYVTTGACLCTCTLFYRYYVGYIFAAQRPNKDHTNFMKFYNTNFTKYLTLMCVLITPQKQLQTRKLDNCFLVNRMRPCLIIEH